MWIISFALDFIGLQLLARKYSYHLAVVIGCILIANTSNYAMSLTTIAFNDTILENEWAIDVMFIIPYDCAGTY